MLHGRAIVNAAASLLVGALGAGCVNDVPFPNATGVSSLEVQLMDPAVLGSPAAPVTAQQATYNVIARDSNGNVVNQDLKVDVFVSFGGIKTGADTACGADASGNTPIETITLSKGKLMNHTTMLPSAYGSTAVWLDDPVSHATGASPTIYFRNPYVSELQTPPDITAANAAFCSPFNNKYIVVDHAQNGGQLIVTSVYSDAFAVADTGATSFNNIFIFSFSQPPASIVPGKVITDFSGNYSKFVGFTEINFPLFDVADDSVPLVPVPPPTALAFADLKNVPKLLGANSGVVSYTGKICDPSPPNPTNDPNIQKTIQSWEMYNQFVIDNDGTCDSFTNFAVELTAKQMGDFDPTKQIGNTLSVVGMLQNHSGQNAVVDSKGNTVSCSATQACPSSSNVCIMGDCYKSAYNFWTILPRTADDITVTPAQ
jgi:hypothetical protein